MSGTGTPPSSARTGPRRSPRRRPRRGPRRSSSRAHSIAELDAQSEHWLGQQGRITHPMIKDPGGTHYAADQLGRGVRADRGPAERGWTRRTRRSSTPRGVPRTRPRSPTSCSSARTAPTTCRTAPTCATSRPAWLCAETIGIGKASVTLDDVHDGQAADPGRPEPGHEPSADAVGAGDRQASRSQDHRDQPAARGRPGQLPQPAGAARRGRPRAPTWPTCTCRSRSTAIWRCSRRSEPC